MKRPRNARSRARRPAMSWCVPSANRRRQCGSGNNRSCRAPDRRRSPGPRGDGASLRRRACLRCRRARQEHLRSGGPRGRRDGGPVASLPRSRSHARSVRRQGHGLRAAARHRAECLHHRPPGPCHRHPRSPSAWMINLAMSHGRCRLTGVQSAPTPRSESSSTRWQLAWWASPTSRSMGTSARQTGVA